MIFTLTQNREFQNVGKLTGLINFSDEEKRPIDQIIDLAKEGIENLSLLDKQMNSSAGSDEIREKLNKYKNARKLMGLNWEYLIQSLVDNSEYYNNEKIQALGLPERKLINIDQNTWELSSNNRQFNIELMKLALKEIANK